MVIAHEPPRVEAILRILLSQTHDLDGHVADSISVRDAARLADLRQRVSITGHLSFGARQWVAATNLMVDTESS
jgi:hypothetical protein